MSYNITVGSTDGINVDKHFGSAKSLLILRANDDETYESLGKRRLE
jgi:hypothetical protein